MGGRTPVDIRNADLDGVTVVLLPAVDVPGRVTFEGSRASADGPAHPVVSFKNELPAVPGGYAELYGSFEDASRFVVNGALEGDYRLRLSDLPQGAYLKSARYGAADVLSGVLHVDPRTPERLEIVLASNAGTVEGSVIDRDRRPVAYAPLANIPGAARRQRDDLSRSGRMDEAGRFRLQGIPPGDYVLFAWEDIEEGLWRNPEFIRRSEGLGKTIHVGENSLTGAGLVAIPPAF
jgi:hypothetical protein